MHGPISRRVFPMFNISILLSIFFLVQDIIASTSQQKRTYDANISRRERNLDHWDYETLAAYLGLDPETAEVLPSRSTDSSNNDSSLERYAGIDAAVMFYAQWCKNCHQFAPIWDTIATMLQAGYSSSNLIMSLFNCEQNEKHAKLCDAAGVTHYPTLMFIGSGPFPDASGLILNREKNKKKKILKRTIKFRGNLNVGDSVLDWIQVMRGLSTWYKWNHSSDGWLRFWRRGFGDMLGILTGKRKKSNTGGTQLPVGVPPRYGITSEGRSSDTATISSYAIQKDLNAAEKKLKNAQKDLEDYKLAATHAGYLIDSFLFPNLSYDHNDTFKPTDVFSKMVETKAWDADTENSDDTKAVVLKACVVDLSLDYCTRLSTKLTSDYLKEISNQSEDKYPSFLEMEKTLKATLKETEPYCDMFNTCYKNDFKDEVCRPSSCPFLKNDGACKYVASCLSDFVQEEYALALGKNLTHAGEGGSRSKSTDQSVSQTVGDGAAVKDSGKKAAAGSAWGIK